MDEAKDAIVRITERLHGAFAQQARCLFIRVAVQATSKSAFRQSMRSSGSLTRTGLGTLMCMSSRKQWPRSKLHCRTRRHKLFSITLIGMGRAPSSIRSWSLHSRSLAAPLRVALSDSVQRKVDRGVSETTVQRTPDRSKLTKPQAVAPSLCTADMASMPINSAACTTPIRQVPTEVRSGGDWGLW